MKFIFALLLVLFIALALSEVTKQEVQELIESPTLESVNSDSGLSILDTVKYIKTKQYTRSLATSKSTSSNADIPDTRRTLYQAYIWIPIILVLIMIYAVAAIFYMDADKEKDTLIYAKFITSYK